MRLPLFTVLFGALLGLANVPAEAAEAATIRLEQTVEWTFRNHVQPVLAKTGCSSGACHGAAAGQNGFRLSLRGYDDEGDFISLTRNAFGRRIMPRDPGNSLMLLKSTGAVAHKGGKRFETNSLEYRVLSEWIASGVKGPRADDPRIERLEISPATMRVKPGVVQPLVVRAYFSDGHSEDVTRWVKFTSANESVAAVNDQGSVTIVSHGEGAITGWYLSRIAVATVTAPYPHAVPPDVFAAAPRRNFIDDEVLAKLQSLNLRPSPRGNDQEFIRRVYLDTLGILPTASEARAFLLDQSAGKRDALIASVLRRPEFIDYWTYKWSDLLLVQSRRLKPAAMWAYYRWIRDQVTRNAPWDKMVRELMVAGGSTLENGAANFYVLHEDPRVMAETATQTFLGMSINCARCHNHPMEKWTNDEYFAFANLFARVRAKNGPAEGESVVFTASRGDLIQPLRGKPQPPRPLDSPPSADAPERDRREALAAWLTSPTNAYFARSVVNRVWANFYGAGLVEAVDDLRATNPASNESLLAAATRFLVDNRFDLKTLMQAMLESETYQRASQSLPENVEDSRFYSRYYARRLMAEVLLDALAQAAAAPTKFKGYPDGWRAVQLPDSNIDSYFLKAFGRPEREKPCECERSDEPSLTQVLHLANGDTINQKLTATNNIIGTLLGRQLAPEALFEEIYLGSLSRLPTPKERERFLKLFGDAPEPERRAVVEDALWAILSSREFLFNH